MRYDLPCEIVEDLLPSYIDELTNETSRESVKGHLETCDKCRKMYDVMTGKEMVSPDEEEKAEIDFLKKSRKVSRKRIITAVISTLTVIVLILGYGKFIAGKTCDPSMIDYELYVDKEFVNISGNIIDKSQGVQTVEYTIVDGTLNIDIKTTGASFIYKNTFESSQGLDEPVKEVTINGSVIAWADGTYISPKVSELFLARNPYAGDMSGNNKLTEALEIPQLLGAFTHELQTDKEPYGWKMIAESDFDKGEAQVIEERFKSYAVILLTCVDNLGYVELDYTCEHKARTFRMTLEDANEFAESCLDKDKAVNIKEYGKTAAGLQKLIELLPIRDYRFTSSNYGLYIGGDIMIHLYNETDSEIYAIGWNHYVNGESRSGGGTSLADGSPLEKGDAGMLAVPSENDIEDVDEDEISFGFTVSDKDGIEYDAGKVILGSINEMKEKYKQKYDSVTNLFNLNCYISGNYEDGFRITIK